MPNHYTDLAASDDSTFLINIDQDEQLNSIDVVPQPTYDTAFVDNYVEVYFSLGGGFAVAAELVFAELLLLVKCACQI